MKYAWIFLIVAVGCGGNVSREAVVSEQDTLMIGKQSELWTDVVSLSSIPVFEPYEKEVVIAPGWVRWYDDSLRTKGIIRTKSFELIRTTHRTRVAHPEVMEYGPCSWGNYFRVSHHDSTKTIFGETLYELTAGPVFKNTAGQDSLQLMVGSNFRVKPVEGSEDECVDYRLIFVKDAVQSNFSMVELETPESNDFPYQYAGLIRDNYNDEQISGRRVVGDTIVLTIDHMSPIETTVFDIKITYRDGKFRAIKGKLRAE